VLPMLVGRRDLAGAVSLNSTQMNASRVIGPALGGVAFATFGPSVVFLLNAATYPFVILALASLHLPPVAPSSGEQGVARVLAGFRVARRDPLVGRILFVITAFSFCCLAFIGQMPVLADRNLGIDPRSTAYGLLYASFGFGAVVGAISVGTVFARRSKPHIVRAGLLAFGAALTALALVRLPALAYPVAVVVGFCYFATVTSLSTVLQQHLDDAVRGRVMALWIMGFGGTVPVGNLVAGPIIGVTSISIVMLGGAVVAVLLAWRAELISVSAADRAVT
jgi:predicted MFS family arabinose efflux permease